MVLNVLIKNENPNIYAAPAVEGLKYIYTTHTVRCDDYTTTTIRNGIFSGRLMNSEFLPLLIARDVRITGTIPVPARRNDTDTNCTGSRYTCTFLNSVPINRIIHCLIS